MSAAHELLVSSRKKQGLPVALEDESAIEQIAMLLNADATKAEKAAAS
jgi:hypothetical protein